MDQIVKRRDSHRVQTTANKGSVRSGVAWRADDAFNIILLVFLAIRLDDNTHDPNAGISADDDLRATSILFLCLVVIVSEPLVLSETCESPTSHSQPRIGPVSASPHSSMTEEVRV